MREIKERCLSRKDYLKKDNSNVGYALYVQDNIRKDDYVRLNTGNIVKVIGIKANTVNKRAIYYGFYKQDWFDSAAVENFSDNIIDLIGCGDIVNRHLIIDKYEDVDEYGDDFWCLIIEDDSLLNKTIREEDIKTILTRESYMANCYKVGGENE